MTDARLPVPAAEFSPEEQLALDVVLAPLRPRMAAFVRHFLTNGGNGAAAARTAGYGGNKWTRSAASRLLKRPDVAAAIDAFKAILARRAAFDFARASDTLMDGLSFAKETGNATAYVRAGELLAKLHGHLSDRVDLRHQGDVAFVFPERRTEKVIDG
jgi:hypothetical protein